MKIKFTIIKNLKQHTYAVIGVAIFIIIISIFILSTIFIFQRINKIFNIDEKLLSQKIIKFDIDGFKKISEKLGIELGKKPTPPTPPTPLTPPLQPVLDKKTLSIKILNGTLKKGLAADLKKIFEENNFEVKEVGNVSGNDYKKTILRIKESKKDFIPLIAEVLRNKYADFTQETLLESEANDVLVIIGIP